MEKKVIVAKKPSKNMRYYMRFLHNNIGYLIAGLLVIYSLSGIVQTYRDTDTFKQEIFNSKTLAPNLTDDQLGQALKIRNFKAEKIEDGIVYFKSGTYNQKTGAANYTTKEVYKWLDRLSNLHQSNSNGIAHYFTTILAVLLFFMAISAFWMFKPGTKLFSRGIIMSLIGVVAAVIMLFI